MRLWTNAAERMRIDSSGNVGIGTSSPAERLTVVAASGLTVAARFAGNTAANNNTQIRFYGANAAADQWAIGNAIATNDATRNFDIYDLVSNANRLRIDSSGNVGIGTSSPGVKLDVYTSGTASNFIRTRNDTTQAFFEAGNGYAFLNASTNHPLIFGTNNTERARIDSSGNLLVGTTVASDATIVGVTLGGGGSNFTTSNVGTQFPCAFRRGGNLVGTISTDTTTTFYNTSSDYRLKENAQPMTGALAKVAALKPCTYTWKADGSDGEGFIAHELAEVVPQCVTGEKDAVDSEGKPVYQGIDTSFLVATLTAGLQEAVAMIDELKAKVAALEGK
jgi:hypothetical protein